MADTSRGFIVISGAIHAAIKRQAERERRTLRVVMERYALEGLAKDERKEAQKQDAA